MGENLRDATRTRMQRVRDVSNPMLPRALRGVFQEKYHIGGTFISYGLYSKRDLCLTLVQKLHSKTGFYWIMRKSYRVKTV